MAVKSEPGWRVVLKKPLRRPPKPEDMPGEELYKLVVMTIRFWGISVPIFNPELRRTPVDPVSAKVGEPFSFVSSGQLSLEDVLRPVPLSKSKKKFEHVVDVLSPDETDTEALRRIEAHYEAHRMVFRARTVQHVMES